MTCHHCYRLTNFVLELHCEHFTCSDCCMRERRDSTMHCFGCFQTYSPDITPSPKISAARGPKTTTAAVRRKPVYKEESEHESETVQITSTSSDSYYNLMNHMRMLKTRRLMTRTMATTLVTEASWYIQYLVFVMPNHMPF